jgi:hypothetical protein
MRKRTKHLGPWAVSLLVFFLFSSSWGADKKKTASPEELKDKALKVFLDGRNLQWDYIRTEITFINYVRDRKDSDVHVLITTQGTGSGGSEYTMSFMGRGAYSDLNFTLKYFSNKTDVSDEVRRGVVRYLKKGLIPFVSRTPLADKVDVVYDQNAEISSLAGARDAWNFWVFSLNAGGSASGVRTRSSQRFEGNISANRVTPDWKIRFALNGQFDASTYYLEDSTTIDSAADRESFSGLAIKSLTNHWSAGFWLSLNSATFNNIMFSYSPSLAVEYNFFPYQQATRRRLYFQYRFSYNSYQYREETVFGKMAENLFRQSLSLNLELTEPWGLATASLRGSHFLQNIDLNRIEVSASLSFRIFRGLSFWVSGGYSAIHDQISLTAASATLDQILLIRRDQATTYSYNINVGFSFTFGSMFSNIVNPRFE